MGQLKHNQSRLLYKNNVRNYSWIYFLASVFILLILLPLFQKGTFIDGMLYKTVAYNYAENLSSFWKMKFTDTCMSFFCEQPPLYFYLLGNFYKLFGVNVLTDKFFTFFLFLAMTGTLFLIIKQVFKHNGYYFFLSLFLLLAIPVICWSYNNQVIEPLVNVFVTLNILFFIKFIKTDNLFFACLFGLGLCALFLTKGFQSCFIITLPISYTLLSRFSKSGLYFSFVSGLILAFAMGFLLLYYEPAVNWFNCYYDTRLVLTMQNVGNTTNDYSEILVRFFTEQIIGISLIFLLSLYLKVKRNYPFTFILKNFVSNKIALSLFIASLFGSFPYALSLVQRGFYLVPSFICFVLALVIGLKRYWLFFYLFLLNIGKYKFAQISSVLLLIASVIYFCLAVDNYKRDEDLIKDIALISPFIQQKDTLQIENCLWNYFSLHSYLYMEKEASLSTNTSSCQLYLKDKNSADTSVLKKAHKIQLNTRKLDLFLVPTH